MRLRDLIPWRSFDILTRWSPEVAAVELKKTIHRGTSSFDQGNDAPFVGDVRVNSEFQFRRRIAYRNSFLPIIRVAVEPLRLGGTRLRVSMRLHALVMAITAVWMTGATLGALAGLPAVFAGQPVGLIALALPLVGAGFVGIPFGIEAHQAESLLRAIYTNAPGLPDPPETGRVYR